MEGFAYLVLGLVVLVGPVLLIHVYASLTDQKRQWRQLQSRVVWLTERVQELQTETSRLGNLLDDAGPTPAAASEDVVEAEAELEQPQEKELPGAPYRPYPSAPPSSKPAPAAEPPAPSSAEAPGWLVPGQTRAEPSSDATGPAGQPPGVASSETVDSVPPAPPTSAASAPPSMPTGAATSSRQGAIPPSPTARPEVPRPPAKPSPPAKPRPPSAFDKWRKQLKEQLAGEGWEAVIGGSWLNKIGSLVTVVGVVLILSWSWANLDPVGRVAMALALSLTLLVFGMVLERRRRYVIVARGFIGTGWAALYVTAYAMHGIETARIIQDPRAGFLVLLAVAVGMILHSLRYRSQTVTGIAYFVTFATLTLTPLTHYSWFASLPLAASLLYLAYRFTWSQMALMGLLVTYGTFMFGIGGLEATDLLIADWNIGQAVLIVYWLMFEAFDLLGIAKSGARQDITATIFPLNAAAFLGISLLEWSATSPETIYLLFAMAGGAYAVSAVLRARLLPDSGLPDSSDVWNRVWMGSYEGAVSIAAALIAVGIWNRYEGLRVGAAWLLEAEILFLIGLQLRRPFLRWLAGVVVVLPVIKLIGIDIQERALLDVMGMEIFVWAPLMLLTAAVLYLNRGLVGIARDLEVILPERAYTYVATALVVIVLGHEVPIEYVGLALLLFALSLFETGLRTRLAELRYQAYGVGALGSLSLVACNVLGFGLDVERPWLSLIPAALLTYGLAVRLHRLAGRTSSESGELLLPDDERGGALDVSSAVGTVVMAGLVWHLLPPYLVAVGWILLALPLFETGLLSGLERIRYQAYCVAALACVWLLITHVFDIDLNVARPWVSLIPAALLAYGAAVRLHRLGGQRLSKSGDLPLPELERSAVLDVSSVVGTVATASLIWYLLPAYLVPVGWLLLAIPLFETGLLSGLARIRYQAYLVAVLACSWLLASHVLGMGLYVERPWLSLIPAALLTYGAAARLYGLGRMQSANSADPLLPDDERSEVLNLSSVAGTVALASLAWYVLPSPLVAVAWGLLGLLLIEIGYWLPLPSLRAQGHVLALSAFARTFLANFDISGATAGVSHRILTVVPLIVLYYYLVSKLEAEAEAGQAGAAEGPARTNLFGIEVGFDIRPVETILTRVYLYLPAILAVWLIRYELGPVAAVIGWATLALTLMVLGVRWQREDLRWQAYMLGILVFARSWSTNFYVEGDVFGLPGRLTTGALVAISLYACQLVSPRGGVGSSTDSQPTPRGWGQLDRHSRTFFSLLATALLTLLLFYEVSGGLLTVAWTLEGTLLLLAGFALRERALRLSGLVLLGACVLKAFVYDFRALDTIYQIMSFIVLGLLMLGISLVYTRYKEQFRRLL